MGAESNHEERAGFNVFAMPCNTLTLYKATNRQL